MNAATLVLAAAIAVHMFILHLIFSSRISEPEAKIRDRVVGFGTLQTFHSVLQTVFLYTVVEALTAELVSRNPQKIRQTIRRIHDSKRTSEAIQKQRCSRLVRVWLDLLRELVRDVRQHMISRIPGRGGEELTYYWSIRSSFYGLNQHPCNLYGAWIRPTLTTRPSSINTGTRDKHVIHDGKHTLAPYPSPIPVLDLAIIQNRRFVELDSSTMYCSGEWDFVGMEILPT